MPKPKPLTVDMLPVSPAYGLFMVCSRPLCVDRRAGNHYSCHRGDYFWMPAGKGFTCSECHAPMMLAREERRIVAA
jgi:hypothetical protein